MAPGQARPRARVARNVRHLGQEHPVDSEITLQGGPFTWRNLLINSVDARG